MSVHEGNKYPITSNNLGNGMVSAVASNSRTMADVHQSVPAFTINPIAFLLYVLHAFTLH